MKHLAIYNEDVLYIENDSSPTDPALTDSAPTENPNSFSETSEDTPEFPSFTSMLFMSFENP